MSKLARTCLCLVLIVGFTVPALAGGPSYHGCSIYRLTSSVYKGGAELVVNTEASLTGCLKHAFGLFNPCLDLVKGCSRLAFAPVEIPYAMLTKACAAPKRAARRVKIPVPKKPKIPK